MYCIEDGYVTAQESFSLLPVINMGNTLQSFTSSHNMPQMKLLLGATSAELTAKTLTEAAKTENQMDKVAALNATMEAYETALEDIVEQNEDNGLGNLVDSDSDDNSNNTNNDSIANRREVNHEIRDTFNKYIANSQYFDGISKNEEDAIKLLRVLRRSKASLETYEHIMEWHFKAKGDLHEWERLSSSIRYLSRERLFKKLARRYNRDIGYNLKMDIIVPHSRAKTQIVYNNLQMVMQSLLTDPRITANDYLFNDKENPFAPPPNKISHYGDINTGLAYRKTYEKLVTNPEKQILLPIICYQDGAATTQFTDLKVTAFQFTLGIFNRRAREKRHLWRTLGYYPSYLEEKSRGKRQLIDSNHMESYRSQALMDEDEGQIGADNVVKAQDFHTLMKALMSELTKLQDTGFIWDLYYNGKTYKDVEFIPFVPFLMCDTEEADRHCSKYLARGQGVAQLCRYCYCPTMQSDNPKADYPLKEWKDIDNMVQGGDVVGLKAISQQNVDNAWHYVQFGLHNRQGVHGACPMEMLHHVLLGIFSMAAKCFWRKLGKDSRLAADLDSLCTEYGTMYQRQSDRDLPKTHFSKGIRHGTKIMAQEHTGVLLLMLTTLLSGSGQHIVGKRKHFRQHGHLADWIMVLETMLQWESWLKLDMMKISHVHKFGEKSRRLMYLIKKVLKRDVGMGLNTTKFHGILHMSQDIKNFGVPGNYDTKTKESHHKETKTAAKLTQKNKVKFDEQVARREFEVDLLELADEELDGRALYNYYHGYEHPALKQPNKGQSTGGKSYTCHWNDDLNIFVMRTVVRMRGKDTNIVVESPLTAFFGGLQQATQQHICQLQLLSEHIRDGTIFRGSLSYRNEIWRDWVVVDWDDWGHLPNKIWGFVDLRQLPRNSGINYGGLENLLPAIYAIVESCSVVEYADDDYSPLARSELFETIRLELGEMQAGGGAMNKFYLADVDAFVKPAAVVPNIGGAINEYLWLTPRSTWHTFFEEWLESPLEDDDFATDVEEESEEEEADGRAEEEDT